MSGTRVETGVRCITDGLTAGMVWRTVLQPWLAGQQGRSVRPELLEFIEQCRLAGMLDAEQRSTSRIGPLSGTSPDMAALSTSDRDVDYTAAEIGEVLHCSTRHVHRLASAHGLTPRSGKPKRWTRADVAVLQQLTRTA